MFLPISSAHGWISRQLMAAMFVVVATGCGQCGDELEAEPWRVEDPEDQGQDQGEELGSCDPGPSLPMSKLAEPCRVSIPCRDEACKQRCEAGDCQNPQPEVCIAGDTYRCAEDERYDPDSRKNRGRFERVRSGCCQVRTPDVAVEIEVLEVPTVSASTKLTERRSLCYEPADADLSVKLRLMVRNRGNVAATIGCSLGWWALLGEHYDPFNYYDPVSSSRSHKLMEPLALGPGERFETLMTQWLTPEHLCDVVVSFSCGAAGSLEMGDSLVEYAPYEESCLRFPMDTMGSFELLPDDACSESKNSTAEKISLRVLP